MKNFLIVICLLFLQLLGITQNTLPDSISSIVDTAQTLKSKTNILKNYARSYAFNDFNFAIKLNEKALELANAKQDSAIILKMLTERGILHLMVHKNKEARPFVKQAISLAKQLNNNLMTGYNCRNLGISYYETQMYDSSAKSLLESLSYLDTNNSNQKYYYGLSCLELGKVFFEMSINKPAEKYVNLAIRIFQSEKDINSERNAYNLLSQIILNSDRDNPNTVYYLEKAIELNKEMNDEKSQIIYNNNLSMIKMYQGKYDEALKGAKDAYRWFKNQPFENNFINLTVNVGRIYAEIGQIDSALHYTNKGIELSLLDTNTYTLEKAYFNLFLIDSIQKKYPDAIKNLRLYFNYALKNSKLNIEKTLTAIEFENALETNNREIAFVKKEKLLVEKSAQMEAKLNNLLIGAIVSLFVILLILLLAYLKIRNQKSALQKSYQKIDSQKNELANLIVNKNTLISIIGHDLRGPISNLYATLDLIPNEQDKISDETNELIGLTKDGLMRAWDLLENLLVWAKTEKNDFSLKPERFLIEDEIKKIIGLYHIFSLEKKLQLSLEGDKNQKIYMDKSAFQTILRNILGNAIKFSNFKDSILINWTLQGNIVKLIIEDNAGGIPEDLIIMLKEPFTNANKLRFNASEGLGFVIIKTFIGLSNLKLEVFKTKKGSRFEIEIPQ